MPYRRRVFSRGPRPVINSIKNVHTAQFGLSGTIGAENFAKAVTSPSPTVSSDVSHGCIVKAFWLSLDVCGIGGTGVLNVADVYIMKNPGANLSGPNPISQGTSNEKKFIIKTWRAMIMRNQDGNVPYHWEGWIRIPKRYQRMGTDDVWQIVHQCTSALTGHMSVEFIYKWYR